VHSFELSTLVIATHLVFHILWHKKGYAHARELCFTASLLAATDLMLPLSAVLSELCLMLPVLDVVLWWLLAILLVSASKSLPGTPDTDCVKRVKKTFNDCYEKI